MQAIVPITYTVKYNAEQVVDYAMGTLCAYCTVIARIICKHLEQDIPRYTKKTWLDYFRDYFDTMYFER